MKSLLTLFVGYASALVLLATPAAGGEVFTRPADSDRPPSGGGFMPPAPPQGGNFDWPGLVEGGVRALINGGKSRNDDWDDEDDGYYPQQYYPQTRQYVPQPPQYVPPKRVAPKNVIQPNVAKKAPVVAVKKSAPLNLVNVDMKLSPASAETNARQQVEAQQAIKDVDHKTAADIAKIGDLELTKAYEKAMSNGSKAEMDKFLAKYGNKLAPVTLDRIKFRQDLAGLNEALIDGSLNAQQRQDLLDQIQADLAQHQKMYPNDLKSMYDALNNRIVQMGNLNTLGRIADSIANGSNPFPVLILGAQQMGMPICFVSEMTGYPVMSIPPVAGNDTATILLSNPESNGQAVSYLLDDHKFEMNAGESQKLDRGYQVSFDPGLGGAQKQYTLTGGVYEWRSDPKSGWSLFKVKVKVEIDNSRYDGEFRYLINNETKSVSAGNVAVHEGDAAIEIAFDGGKGEEIRKHLKSGRYVVGLDPERGQLDLFELSKVEEAAAKEPEYLPSTLVNGSKATQSQRVAALLSQAGVGGHKVVSPLGGGGGSTASVEDLLKSIKPKNAVAVSGQ